MNPPSAATDVQLIGSAPLPPLDGLSFSSFTQQYPLTPAQQRLLYETALHLQTQQSWTDLALLTVPSIPAYVVRGVSRRLAAQQKRDRERREQERERREKEEEEEGARASASSALPALLDSSAAAAPPPFQYVLPLQADSAFSHAHVYRRLLSLLSTRSLLLSAWTPPSYFTFLPFYDGIFHVLPRSVLTKEDPAVQDAEGEEASEERQRGKRGNRQKRKRKQRNGGEEEQVGYFEQEHLDAPAPAYQLAPPAPSEPVPSAATSALPSPTPADASTTTPATAPSPAPAASTSSAPSSRRPRRVRHEAS